MKILVVEDEKSLAETIVRALSREGYVVESAYSFEEARIKIELFEYECILLDIMLPDGSGLELLRELKSTNKLGGVIIISAKDSIDDKVVGLNLGADDYLAKPFHLSELTARINSIIRRKGNSGGNIITLNNVTIALDRSFVKVNGELLDLSRKEYDILLHFAMRKGHIISKESLAESVWGDFVDHADNFDFIYTHVKNLRRKLAMVESGVEIKSVYGFGYKLVSCQ
ncbi:MAG: response regulator transcription factor [Rikenellaceae bacterium]